MDRLPGDTPEEQAQVLRDCFREVFSGGKGQVVFNVLLTDLRFFAPCYTEADVALRNYAVALVTERMGIRNTVMISDYMARHAAECAGDNNN